MREILFRGKKTEDGGWVEGAYLGDYFSDGSLYCIRSNSGNYSVEPDTVGQYTGLVDRNGTKIFEGDICRYREVVDGETLLDESGSVLLYHGSWTLLNKFGYIAVGQCSRDVLEVIGNIHDNPELLEKKGA